MSKVVRIEQPGGPEQLVIADVQVGEPGPGEIRIRHKAVPPMPASRPAATAKCA